MNAASPIVGLPYAETVWGRALYVGLGGLALGFCFPPYGFPIAFLLIFVPYPIAEQYEPWECFHLGAIGTCAIVYPSFYYVVNFTIINYIILPVFFIPFAVVGFYLIIYMRPLNEWKIAGITTMLWAFSPELMLARIGTILGEYPLLLQPARLFGETIWGGLIVLTISALTGCLLRRHRRPLFMAMLCLLFMGGMLFYSHQHYFGDDPEPISEQKLALIQPNVPAFLNVPNEAVRRRYNKRLSIMKDQINRKTRPGDFVIMPESAGPGFLYEIRNGELTYKAEVVKRGAKQQFLNDIPDDRHYLFGATVYDPVPGPTTDRLNTAIMIDGEGTINGFYTKHLLMPFGEYLPGMRLAETTKHVEAILGQAARRSGNRTAPFVGPSGTKYGILICLEDMYFDYMRSHLQRGAEAFITITNDSWTDDVASHWLHYYRAQIRAIEVGHTVVRNGLTGISAVIDRRGKGALLEPHTRGVLRVTVPEGESTVFLKYGPYMEPVAPFIMLIIGFGLSWLRGGE